MGVMSLDQQEEHITSSPESSIFIRILRLVFSMVAKIGHLFYRLFSFVGELSLFSCYLFLMILRGIGRVILFVPLGLVTFFFRIVGSIGAVVLWVLKAVSKLILSLISVPQTGELVSVLKKGKPRKKPLTLQKRFALFFRKSRKMVKRLFRRKKSPKHIVHPFPGGVLFLFREKIDAMFFHYHYVRTHYEWRLAFSGAVLCLFIGSLSLFYTEIVREMPDPFSMKQIKMSASTRILDRNNNLLYKIYRHENRTMVSLADLPPYVRMATIAIEDSDFYHHKGISIRGILRAASVNFLHKGDNRIEGGSTITQQLVKNLLLSPKRTVQRKIREMLLALVMESSYTKDEILQMYVNEVPYGGTSYGIEEASYTYFGKSSKYLTLPEAALLAALPSQPSLNSPFVDLDAAVNRQHLVLRRMVENKFITQAQADEAKQQKLVFVPQATPILAPHFVMMVREALIDQFGETKVEEGGLSVVTTLDLNIQRMAEKAVRDNIAKIGKPYRVGNGAALVTHPNTGEVLALVGSVNYFDESIKGNVNVVTSLRQPGSSVKPINYGYAFDHGWTPSSVIDDSPVVYQIAGSTAYAPQNYDGKFHGRVTLRAALANSYNIPSVKLLATYGPEEMVKLGRAMGITTWDDPKRYGLALALGAAEIRMIDMATAYGVIANMGIRRDPVLIRKVTDTEGHVLVDNTVKGKMAFSGIIRLAQAETGEGGDVESGTRVLSKVAAYDLISIMTDCKARLPAFGPYSKLCIDGKTMAAKTGTTNDFRDNWTYGFTPEYLTATWVGNTDNSPMNSNLVSGITGAAPMMHEIMTNLTKDRPDRVWAPPSDMIPVKICATNGLLTCANCPQTVTEYFLMGTEPKKACSFESADTCNARKAQAETEGKSPEEVNQITANCITPPPAK